MGGRRICDLRVVDLRSHLEKRGLDTKGNKAALVERLTQALDAEGINPEEYLMGDVETAGKDKPSLSSGGDTTEGEGDASEELPPETEEGPEALTVMEVVNIDESKEQENGGHEENVDKSAKEQESVVQHESEEQESAVQDQNEEKESAVQDQNEEKESVVQDQIEQKESAVQDQNEEQESVIQHQSEEQESVVQGQNEQKESVVQDQIEQKESAVSDQNEEHESADNEKKKDKSADQESENVDNSKSEEHENKDDSIALPESENPAETVKMEVKLNTSTDAGVDDDNYALNLTIGEEEDKFMMDGEDGNPDTSPDNSFHLKLAVVPLSSITCENADESKSASPGPMNATQAESEGKLHTEKSSEEGGGTKPARKSKDEDRNTLLVTGLSSQTAATEIKAVFKKHGKIGGVKIMSNVKDPDGSRFALVSVMSSEDAMICIQNLDGFALNGHVMHVDKARDEMLTADWMNSHSSKSKNKDGKKSANGGASGSTPPSSPPKDDSANISVDPPATEKSPQTDSSKDVIELDGKNSVDQKSDLESPTKTSTVSSGLAVSSSSDSIKVKVESKSKRRSSNDSGSGSHKHRRSRSPEERRGRSREVGFRRREFHPRPFRGGRLIRSHHPRYRYHDEDEEERREEYRRRLMERRELLHRRRHGSPHRHHRHSLVRRSRSPLQRVPFHRGGSSPEGRRSRQPELTFEEIYDTRQREKDREMERERREIERRRMEEAEKQRMLDEEFRLLAKERERIEAEKAELKRQKEKMIMEEREKQRIEQAEIEREKAILARKVKVKNLEEQYRSLDDNEDSKKTGRHNFMDTRSDKDKMRPHPYRKDDASRFLDRTSGMRGAPIRNAPVREVREHVSPSWETNERRDTKPRGHVKGRDDSANPSGSGGSRYSAAFDTSGAGPQRIVANLPRSLDYILGASRDPFPRPGGNSYTGDSSMLRTGNWTITNRIPSWGATERTAGRPGGEIPDRWGGGTSNMGNSAGARLSIPVAPPPPIFSSTVTAADLNLDFNTYSGDYNYKLPSSMSSNRR